MMTNVWMSARQVSQRSRRRAAEGDWLHTLQLQHSPHGFVDAEDAVAIAGLLLTLGQEEADGDEQVDPAPEGEVAAERHEADLLGRRAEPLVAEVGRVEGEEDGVGEELAGRQADRLGRRGVREVFGGDQRQRPACTPSAAVKGDERAGNGEGNTHRRRQYPGWRRA